MRHITFDPAALTGADRQWWDTWEKRASDATVGVINDWEAGKDIDWDRKDRSDVWKDLKTWLLANVFDGKCAYCETRGARFSSDAEHYRPKGRVDDFDPTTKKWARAKVEWPDGKVETHPGYFWLAFHWKNLVPACEKCNSGAGKQNKFPLRAKAHVLVPRLTAAQAKALATSARASAKFAGRYYLGPEALDEFEQPALLHPYVDNPHEHIRFGRGGIVTAVDGSKKGVDSIDTFKLDDPALTVDRQRQQQKAELQYRMSLSHEITNMAVTDPFTAALNALVDFNNGKEAYSVAALDYISILRAQFQLGGQGGNP